MVPYIYTKSTGDKRKKQKNWVLLKSKTFVLQRISSRTLTTHEMWANICKLHIWERLIFRIYKEHLLNNNNNNNKNQITQLKTGWRNWINSFLKRIYVWSTNIKRWFNITTFWKGSLCIHFWAPLVLIRMSLGPGTPFFFFFYQEIKECTQLVLALLWKYLSLFQCMLLHSA